MGIEVDSATGAAHWASYLVNGDSSGLEDSEVRVCDRWAERLAADGWRVVDVVRDDDGNAEEARFSWSFGVLTGHECAGGELLDYTIHKSAAP